MQHPSHRRSETPETPPDLTPRPQSADSQGSFKKSAKDERKPTKPGFVDIKNDRNIAKSAYFDISPYTERRGDRAKSPGRICNWELGFERENVSRASKSSKEDTLERSATFTKEDRRSLSPNFQGFNEHERKVRKSFL